MNKVYKNYFGAKNGHGSYQQIINHIRPHDEYSELFGGSGAVIQMKKPAEINHFNDIDQAVYQKWCELRTQLDIPKLYIHDFDTVSWLPEMHFYSHKKYCMYLDPPYPLSSRRSSKKVYPHEMTDAQHYQLLENVKNLPSNVDVLISTYQNKIYSSMLKDWELHTFTSHTWKGKATEYLYMNYTNSEARLHQYDYLGENYVDRQRIKRKIDREVKKLVKLPAAERQAIITAVTQLV